MAFLDNNGVSRLWYNIITYVGTKIQNSIQLETITASIPVANWLKVCYGNGKFVAIATSGEIAYSENGVNWTEATLPTTGIWRGIAYGNGKFVVTGYNGTTAMYSADGISWTTSTLPVSEQWYDVAFGCGKFVAISSNSANENSVAYSTDGIDWAASSLPTTYMQSITYGNDRFVAVAYNNEIGAYSNDGINWVASTLPTSANWSDVQYGDGKFIAVINGSDISAYSNDGINWTQTNMPVSANWNSISYGNGIYTAIVYGSDVAAYSENGVDWTSTNMPSNINWNDIVYGDGKFVAVALNNTMIASSYDGVNWSASAQTLQNLNNEDITKSVKEALGVGDCNTQISNIQTQMDSLKTTIITDDTSGDKTIIFTTSNVDTEYRYVSTDGITSLTFNSDASNTFANTTEAYYYVIFKSGTTATTITNTLGINFTGNDCSDGIFAPLSSKTYEIGIWWNGISWQAIVRGI